MPDKRNKKERFMFRKVTSGEHKGFWCVSYKGLGIYGITKGSAVQALTALLYRSSQSKIQKINKVNIEHVSQ